MRTAASLKEHDERWINQKRSSNYLPTQCEMALCIEQNLIHDKRLAIGKAWENCLAGIASAFDKEEYEKPVVFISFAYSEKKFGKFENWIIQFCQRLVRDLRLAGIDCCHCETKKDDILNFDSDMRRFMKKGIEESDFVVYIGTELFNYKATHLNGQGLPHFLYDEIVHGVNKYIKMKSRREFQYCPILPIIISGAYQTSLGAINRNLPGDVALSTIDFVQNKAADGSIELTYITALQELIRRLYIGKLRCKPINQPMNAENRMRQVVGGQFEQFRSQKYEQVIISKQINTCLWDGGLRDTASLNLVKELYSESVAGVQWQAIFNHLKHQLFLLNFITFFVMKFEKYLTPVQNGNEKVSESWSVELWKQLKMLSKKSMKLVDRDISNNSEQVISFAKIRQGILHQFRSARNNQLMLNGEALDGSPIRQSRL